MSHALIRLRPARWWRKQVYRNRKRIYPQPRCQASRDVHRLQYTQILHCKRGTLQTRPLTGVCETLLANVVVTEAHHRIVRMIVANVRELSWPTIRMVGDYTDDSELLKLGNGRYDHSETRICSKATSRFYLTVNKCGRHDGMSP